MTCFARGAHHALAKLTRGQFNEALAPCVEVDPAVDGLAPFVIRFGYDTLSLDWTMDPVAARRVLKAEIAGAKVGEIELPKEYV